MTRLQFSQDEFISSKLEIKVAEESLGIEFPKEYKSF